MNGPLNKRQQARNEKALQDLVHNVPGNNMCADCQARNPGPSHPQFLPYRYRDFLSIVLTLFQYRLGIMECTSISPNIAFESCLPSPQLRTHPLRLGANHRLLMNKQLGIFLCMRCASIHRKLGTHVSKVKSLSMDGWSNEQVEVHMAPQHG